MSTDLLTAGNVVQLPSGSKQSISVRIIEIKAPLFDGQKAVFFQGERIMRDSKALRASHFTISRKPKLYSVMPFDAQRIRPCTDKVILAAAQKNADRELAAA